MTKGLRKLRHKNYMYEYLLKKAFSFLEDCKNVLDLGCGNGEFIELDPKKISGIDNNRETVRLCKEKKLNVTHGDATKLPYEDNSFDGLHCAHLIEHLYPEGAYTMLKEVGRVLKKDGIFVLSTPLLWEGFFEDFTHVKPYYPGAVMRYLVNDGAQKTLEDFPYHFKKVSLYYRFRPIPLPGRVGRLVGNTLYIYGIHTLSKDAYTLVLQKI